MAAIDLGPYFIENYKLLVQHSAIWGIAKNAYSPTRTRDQEEQIIGPFSRRYQFAWFYKISPARSEANAIVLILGGQGSVYSYLLKMQLQKKPITLVLQKKEPFEAETLDPILKHLTQGQDYLILEHFLSKTDPELVLGVQHLVPQDKPQTLWQKMRQQKSS